MTKKETVQSFFQKLGKDFVKYADKFKSVEEILAADRFSLKKLDIAKSEERKKILAYREQLRQIVSQSKSD